MTRALTTIVAVAIAVGLVGTRAAPASADTTIHVTTTDPVPANDGKCGLAEAVGYAGGDTEPDCSSAPRFGTTTVIVPSGCYRISAYLGLGPATVIDGAGPGAASCAGGGTVIVQTSPSWVLLNGPGSNSAVSGVTLTGGRAGGPCPDCDGGGVLNEATLTLSNDLITGNAARDALSGGTAGRGGGIFNAAGATLTVTDSTVSGNTAGQGAPGGSAGGIGGAGGGLYNAGGRVTITGSTISRNAAGNGGAGAFGVVGTSGGLGGDGGGILNDTTSMLTIERTTIRDNRAGDGGAGGSGNAGGDGQGGGFGGGIFNAAQMNLTDSTVSGNSAGDGGAGGRGVASPGTGGIGGFGAPGGGVVTSGDPVVISNVTVSGNSAGAAGAAGPGSTPGSAGPPGIAGGIYADGPTAIETTTIAANTATADAGLLAGASARVVETASVIAGDVGQGNCGNEDMIVDGGHNIGFGDTTCRGAQVDPKLGALQDNGGPTETIALGAGSGALDLVPPGSDCPATDQRGVARPQGAACDAGAYEAAPPLISGPSASATASTAAVVTAAVNPDLRDANVLVRYGTTTSHGAASAARDIGSGNASVPVALALSGLAPGTTYHARLIATNADGTSTSPDLTFVTSSAAGPPGPPVLSHVRESATRWLRGTAGARISRRSRLPVGTTFSFTLNEAASANFTFTQALPGRRVRGRCVAPTRQNRRNRSCRRTTVRGALSFVARRGTNRVRFDGILSRGVRLSPGRYSVAIVASIAAGARRSRPSTLTFTIVRGRR